MTYGFRWSVSDLKASNEQKLNGKSTAKRKWFENIYIYAAMPKGDTGTGNLDSQIQPSKVILANNCTCPWEMAIEPISHPFSARFCIVGGSPLQDTIPSFQISWFPAGFTQWECWPSREKQLLDFDEKITYIQVLFYFKHLSVLLSLPCLGLVIEALHLQLMR